MLVKLTPGVDGIHLLVKVERECDEKNDNESSQEESAEEVWHQVVPFWPVETCCVSKKTQAVVRKKIKSFNG